MIETKKPAHSHLENNFYIAVESSNTEKEPEVLNQRDSFALFNQHGDMRQVGKNTQGLYHNGTRYLSNYQLKLNSATPILLSSRVKSENNMFSVDLTNPDMRIPGTEMGLHKCDIYIGRSIFIREGALYEEIIVRNHAHQHVNLEMSISFEADYKDIFQIRGLERKKSGTIAEPTYQNGTFTLSYDGLDNHTYTTEIHLDPAPKTVANLTEAIYQLKLKNGEEKRITICSFCLHHTENNPKLSFDNAKNHLRLERESIDKLIANVRTNSEQFNHWINRSKTDLLSLLGETSKGKYPYAGVPWYNTTFGRDGLLTAFECLWLAPQISRDVLLFLAEKQATEEHPELDAEPGKILHEARSGEMAELGEVPFKLYYGTIDATLLFVMLAGHYYRRSNDLETISRIWPQIELALKWIDDYGDQDGDGFVEYKHKAENGLTNQGWKDSYDSIMYADGKLAKPPIAW